MTMPQPTFEISVHRPTSAFIDLAALEANTARLGALAGVPLWAVVKADAYGHGAVAIGRALARHPAVCGLAVSLLEEALELRAAGISGPIMVMGPTNRSGYRELTQHDLTPLVSSFEDLEKLNVLPNPPAVHLKVDTGMSRLGFHADEIDRAAVSGLLITGIGTHLACADGDDPDDPNSLTRKQLIRFGAACAAVKRRLGDANPIQRHAGNSSALVKFPAARLDAIRPGLALYGNGIAREPVDLDPVLHLVTEVAQVRDVRAGESVSYDAVWRAGRDSRIAILPVGYADGYPRRLTGKAGVNIGNTRFPIVGTVCMDMAMVDVTDAGTPVVPGDEVILLGGQRDSRITVAELAAWAGLSEYEVTCGISKRVPRRVLKAF
jgi:alanine racemase